MHGMDVDVVWGCMNMGGLLGWCAMASMQTHEYRYGCGIEGCMSVGGLVYGCYEGTRACM